MKTKTFITCIVVMIALCMLSCNNDEDEVGGEDKPQEYWFYRLSPADGITESNYMQ
jgi:hypothetical protein